VGLAVAVVAGLSKGTVNEHVDEASKMATALSCANAIVVERSFAARGAGDVFVAQGVV
jgi:hypothetical protein